MAEQNRVNKKQAQSGTRRGPKANTPARMADIEEVRRDLTADIATATTPEYTEYVALLTQSGSGPGDAPVATVLKNDLGTTVTWARVNTGGYTATAGSAIFDAAKTILIAPANGNNVGDYGLGIASDMQVFNFYRSSDTVLNLGTGNLATATGVVTASDDNLYGSNMVIIRVYS